MIHLFMNLYVAPVFVFFIILAGLSDGSTKKQKKDNNSKVLYSFLQEEAIKVEHIVWGSG